MANGGWGMGYGGWGMGADHRVEDAGPPEREEKKGHKVEAVCHVGG